MCCRALKVRPAVLQNNANYSQKKRLEGDGREGVMASLGMSLYVEAFMLALAAPTAAPVAYAAPSPALSRPSPARLAASVAVSRAAPARSPAREQAGGRTASRQGATALLVEAIN